MILVKDVLFVLVQVLEINLKQKTNADNIQSPIKDNQILVNGGKSAKHIQWDLGWQGKPSTFLFFTPVI